MIHRHTAFALLVAASLGGAVACSHDQPRNDEALLVLPGTTSGGTGMGGVEPAAPQARYGTRSVTLGAINDPAAGSAAGSTTTTTTSGGAGTTIIVSGGQSPYRTSTSATSGYPGAPVTDVNAPNTVGTVNGDYGPLPSSGDAVPAATYGTPGGVITH